MANYDIPTEPKVEGEHWTVREMRVREEHRQCKDRKDKAYNMIRFSALLSISVTVFIITSQQGLRLDQTSIDINLWANLLMSLSLVFAQLTVFVGFLFMHWMYVYMFTLSAVIITGKGPDCLDICHMHSVALRQSYMPLILTCLPFLLISSVTLFLIGIIVSLFELGWHIAVPGTFVVICMSALFGITVALPALQSALAKRAWTLVTT